MLIASQQLNVLQQIVQQLFAQLLSFLCTQHMIDCNICFVFAQPLFIYIFAQHLIDLRFATTDQQFASAVHSADIILSSAMIQISSLRSYFVRISSLHQISSALCSDLYCASDLSSALSSDLFSCSRLPSAVGHICLQLFQLLVMNMLQLIVLICSN
ncbi:hypothetical protein F511_29820 [Dorcoceras hygrometricum]|uniref:Uncharacterized protein n=1 Tax=Dorcoceras hygrometricum TaxID=472368 RepID=A0A2Z7D8W8_9LAMI|nr:hypothetical protein F511_29820 [Dorcoceras hygrometricum]